MCVSQNRFMQQRELSLPLDKGPRETRPFAFAVVSCGSIAPIRLRLYQSTSGTGLRCSYEQN